MIHHKRREHEVESVEGGGRDQIKVSKMSEISKMKNELKIQKSTKTTDRPKCEVEGGPPRPKGSVWKKCGREKDDKSNDRQKMKKI